MNLENKWKDFIDDKTINLLEAWIERRIRNGTPKTAYLPNEVQRFEVQKKTNKNGTALFSFIEHTGLDFSRSTRPKECDSVEVFGINCFRSLNQDDQIIILSYADPFDEFKNIHDEDWLYFLQSMCFRKNSEYERELENSMRKLQKRCEECDLVRQIFDDDVVETWNDIAAFLRRSVPTAIKMYKEDGLPVAIIGGVATSRKSLLENYMNSKFEKCFCLKPNRNTNAEASCAN